MDVDCVIMAGGKGTRLRPLTCDRPKPLVPVVNRPMLEYAFMMLGRAGVDHAILTLHYLPYQVVRRYGKRAMGGKLRLDYSVEEVALGTAGSVRALLGRLNRTILVASGDSVTDIDVSQALSFHRAVRALVTIVLTRVAVPLEYGVVVTDEAGRVVRFLEKPGWSEVMTDTVNTGIYVIEPEALEAVPEGREFDFSKDLFPLLLERGSRLFGWVAKGYWCDVGSLEQYRLTHEDVLGGKTAQAAAWPADAAAETVGSDCRIDRDAAIHPPVVVGDRCVIERGAEVGPYVVLGADCAVRRGASISRSVAWREVEVGAATQVRGAVLCDKALIRTGACVLEGAVVGPGSVVGERARVEQAVRLWPGKRIDREVTVTGDVVWSAGSSRRLFGSMGVSGSVVDELAPENAVRLGSALGHCLWSARKSAVAPRVAVTADDGECASLVKDAIATGLAAAGIGVVDLGESTTPVTCYGVQVTSSAAGVHVRKDPAGDGLLAEFLDGTGLPVDRAYQRRLENAFAAGEFRRVASGSVARIERQGEGRGEEMLRCYERDLLRAIDVSAIARARLTVGGVGQSQGRSPALAIVNRVLAGAGCGAPPRPTARAPVAIAGAAAGVTGTAPADLTFQLDSNGENLSVVDETGRRLASDTLLALACMGSRASVSGGRPDLDGRVIPLPATASVTLEERLASWGGRVIRVSSSDRSLLLRRALEHRACISPVAEGPAGSGTIRFVTVWDGVAQLLVLLELMARNGLSCSRLSDLFPRASTAYTRVPCPWDAKAPVMRMLAEEARNWGSGRVDLSEGVRVFHDNGWALIVPDADLPQFRVFCEAASAEEANHLLGLYASRIRFFTGGPPRNAL